MLRLILTDLNLIEVGFGTLQSCFLCLLSLDGMLLVDSPYSAAMWHLCSIQLNAAAPSQAATTEKFQVWRAPSRVTCSRSVALGVFYATD